MKTKITLFVAVIAVALFGVGCASTQPAFVSDGLVAYYPFNGNAEDETGIGIAGDVKGAVLTADRNGKSNRAFKFDGEDDSIEFVEHAQSNTLPLAVSFWFMAEGPIKNRSSLVDKYHDGSYHGWAIRTAEDNSQKIWPLYIASANSLIIGRHHPSYPQKKQFETNPVSSNVWHHLVLTVDNIKGVVYLDGIRQDEMPWVGNPRSVTAASSLVIGNAPAPSRIDTNPFKGSIDDVRIYSRALSSEEVKALYDLEKPKTK